MLNDYQIQRMKTQGRYVGTAISGDEDLGPLKQLPGTWQNLPNLSGRGWNMIALPFASGTPLDYRLLLNQYNEELKFTLVDKAVPNRGINQTANPNVETDQFVVTLDYEQTISQLIAEDFPVSGDAGAPGIAIHHEPGLWLHMTNEITNSIDIARLGTIPHGDSVLALGTSEELDGAPVIPAVNGLPIGVSQDLAGNPYLSPYKKFNDSPFLGTVPPGVGFPGFNPVEPQKLLELANDGIDIVTTTKLEVDTSVESGGIVNIPFIVKKANAADMKSTFWIQELAEKDDSGNPKLRLQYLQIVILDFFDRRDGLPGFIRWPHVSINTMEKVTDSA